MTELRQFSFIKLVFTGLFLAVISACGGGGGDGPGFIGGGIDDPGDGGGGSAGGVTITLTDTEGNPTSTVSSSSPGIVSVAFTGGQGALVSVTTTAGSITPASSLTNEDGIASFVLEAADESGAGTVTATIDEISVTVNFQVEGSAGPGNNTLTLALTDNVGNPVNNITDFSPGTLTVTVRDAFGQPAAGQIVSATTTIGAISPSSGTALTDLNGVANFTLVSQGVTGAGVVTASLGEASSSLTFEVGEASLQVGRFVNGSFVGGEIDAGATSLPAAGSTPLSVSVVNADGDLVSSAVAVSFTSGCASLTPPLADLPGSVNTINGVATATYTAEGCTGTDVVTASIEQGNNPSATVSLSIATADVSSILFLDADPQTIALQGTGGAGRSETSSVSFQVLDTTGSPAAGADVAFSLSTTIGGMSLTNAEATTNTEGIARAIVQAGNVSTSVRVTASVDVNGTQLSTVSDRLIVSTGLPDQNSVSMGPETSNPGGWDRDGVTTEVTVRMADKFNNPVPDGTVAFFTTEYGSIVDSCELVGGACAVTWTSQAPRFPLISNDTGADGAVSTIFNRECPDYIDPANPAAPSTGRPCPSSLGGVIAGNSSLVVIAVGEESFIDTNGNGLYDLGEPFQDLPEAWLDKNLNGVFDNTPPLCSPDTSSEAGRECGEGLEEIYFDFNEDGVYNEANGIYNGSLCPQDLEAAGQCTKELLHVRGTNEIQMSNATVQRLAIYEAFDGNPLPPLEVVGSISMPSGGEGRGFIVAISDSFNNPPPAGSTVSIVTDGCEITSDDSTVPNISQTGAYLVGFLVKNVADNPENLTGDITITLGLPGASPVSRSIPCVDIAN